MTFRQLEYFAAVAEEGSISGAAKRLEVSQPPVTIQIQLLESELGVALLERKSRGISLTECGQLFYRRARSVLDMMQSVTQEMAEFGKGLCGRLSLGTISSSAWVLKSGQMKRFWESCPQVTFDVREGNTFELLELLRKGNIEIAVIRTPFQPDGLECQYLEEEPMVAAGKPELLEGLPAGYCRAADLAGRPLIYYRRFESLIRAAFQRAGTQPTVLCVNDDARTSMQWACCGHGIVLVPQSLFESFQEPGLDFRLLTDSDLTTRMAVARLSDRRPSLLSDLFMAAFEKNSDLSS